MKSHCTELGGRKAKLLSYYKVVVANILVLVVSWIVRVDAEQEFFLKERL